MPLVALVVSLVSVLISYAMWQTATGSTRAAHDANELLRESARARIAVDSVEFTTEPHAGQDPAAVIRARNSGVADAVEVRIQPAFLLLAELPPQMPARAVSYPSQGVFSGGSSKTSDVRLGRPLTGEEATALVAQKLYLFVFGTITYSTLGRNYETEFCLRAQPQNPKAWTVCDRWNTTR